MGGRGWDGENSEVPEILFRHMGRRYSSGPTGRYNRAQGRAMAAATPASRRPGKGEKQFPSPERGATNEDRVRSHVSAVSSMRISQEANIVRNTRHFDPCCAPVGALTVLGTVYLGRRSAAAPLRLPQAGLFGPLRGNSRMRPFCSAAHGRKADTLVRDISKLPLFRRPPTLPSFHHPSLALPVYIFVHVSVATGRHGRVGVSQSRTVTYAVLSHRPSVRPGAGPSPRAGPSFLPGSPEDRRFAPPPPQAVRSGPFRWHSTGRRSTRRDQSSSWEYGRRLHIPRTARNRLRTTPGPLEPPIAAH